MSDEKLLINDMKSNNSEDMSHKQIEELARDLDATYPGRCEYPHKNCDSCPAKDYRDNEEIPCEAVLHAIRLIERWGKKENG